MKKLTIQFLSIALVMIALYATETHAQKVGHLDKIVKTTIEANGKKTFKISGKIFKSMSIKQTKGGKFKYELRRGSEFLSSGHSTGFKVQVKSDGRSTYSITIINEENKTRPIELSFINDVTEP